MSALKDKKLFLLDMDGTLYIDNELIDGAKEFLSYVKSVGGRYMFLTNNSSKSVDKYIKKLASLGIKSEKKDFTTSVNATIGYLKKKNYNKIYSFGTASFVKQLSKADLPVTTQMCDGIDCLCMGFDTEITFNKIEDACILLTKGVDYVATNPDWVCPTNYGFVPDCGSVAQMLYNATKRMPIFIGKPQPEMVYLAMREAGVEAEETVIVGDRLYTDVACGVNAGISSVLVLSGEATVEDVEKSEIKPEFIYNSIKELYLELASR